MRLKTYQIFTLVFLFFILVYVVLIEVQPTELYRPDNWAQMSISVGASILTLVGIITSIVMSNENNRRVEFNGNLNAFLKKTEEKERINPDRSLTGVYGNSRRKIQAIIDTMSPLRYAESIMGLLSFFLFLASSLSAVLGHPFKLTLGTFLFGVALLTGYVLYVVEEFAKIDRFSSPLKKKGKLSLLAVRVNGTAQHFEGEENEFEISFNHPIERMEFRVRFEGNIRNGFLHATVRFRNGSVSFIPDSNTYLSNFGFINDFQLTLLEKDLDTGVLQGSEPLDLSFDLVLRSERGSEENPLIARGLIERLGEMEVYKYCSIPEDILVDFVEIRVYEDPFFKSNYKRREIDGFTLRVNRQT